MLPTPFTFTTEKRQNRSLIQDVTPFLNNIIFQYTNPLPFETEPHILHTIPLVREHCDSYLYYIQYKTLDITPSQTTFQVIFNPVKGINSGTFYRTIHPKNITLSIQDVFHTYMQKLIDFNENQNPPLYRPSHLQELKHRSEYFEVPDLDTKVQRHDNPHYWLQRDILQIKHFQYRFFNNIILTDDTIPQVKIFTQFSLKFLRFNYQLLWEQNDQQAYVNFPQILTHIELLPYIIKNENKHLHYRDLTSFNVKHFEQINLDHNFVLEHSETSDNRLFLHLILLMKQLLKNKPLVLNLHIRDNNQNNQNKNPQRKKPLLIFSKILIFLKNNHYTHHYHRSLIYNNQILLKQIQFTIHQNSLKKQYKIHEVLQ